MDKNILVETANKMMMRPKGILAMDESSPTIAKRLASINVDNNEDNRRRYRELIITAPKLSDYISCLLYTSPSPRDRFLSRMPSSA